MLERTSSPPPAERDLDVCLLASLTDGGKISSAQCSLFAARICHLRLVPLGFAKTETTKSYLAVAERNAILQRSKTLAQHSLLRSPLFRMAPDAGWTGQGLLHRDGDLRRLRATCPRQAFYHGRVGAAGAVLAVIYLEHEEERTAIARAGRALNSRKFYPGQQLSRLLEQITQGRYFSLGKNSETRSGDAEPLPGSLQKSIRRDSARSFRHALRADLGSLFATAEPPPPNEDVGNRAREDYRVILETPSGFTERFALQRATEERGETLRISENDGIVTSIDGDSVIITLYNYQDYIHSCVQSLNEAALDAIPGGIEILIVDDASTDQSLRQAQRARDNSILPLRIIEKKSILAWRTRATSDCASLGPLTPLSWNADNLIFPRALRNFIRRSPSLDPPPPTRFFAAFGPARQSQWPSLLLRLGSPDARRTSLYRRDGAIRSVPTNRPRWLRQRPL